MNQLIVDKMVERDLISTMKKAQQSVLDPEDIAEYEPRNPNPEL